MVVRIASVLVVSVLSAVPLLAQSTASFSGVVRNQAGIPLADMTVQAYNPSGVPFTGATNSQGGYLIIVPTGTYRLVAYDNSGTYAVSFYGSAASFDQTEAINVTQGQVVTANFTLPPGVPIRGFVLDAAGARLRGAVVAAYNVDGSRRTFVQTNADGTFTLTVPPGTYKLVAYHQALPYIPVFHAGQQLFENATLITAPANVTFVLRPGVKVRGTVKEAPIGVPLAGLDVVAYGLAGDLQYRTETNPAGEFAFVLPEGTAFKFAVEDEGGNYRTTFYQDATSFASAATIVANVGAPILQFSIPRAGDAESKTTLFIPGVIHARNDAGGTFFKTDIWIQNPAEESLDVEVAYLPAGQDNSAVTAVPITVPAQGQTALLDIVESVFGASGAGALRLEAAQPFRATSRTYNEPVNADEIGTFGLSIPAQSVSATLSRATLAGLARDSEIQERLLSILKATDGASMVEWLSGDKSSQETASDIESSWPESESDDE